MTKQELIDDYEDDLEVLAQIIANLSSEDESWESLNCEMAFKRLFLFQLRELK